MVEQTPSSLSLQKSTVDKKEKDLQISRIVSSSAKVSISKLRELAISSYGLIKDELRRKVWPLLLGISTDDNVPPYDKEKLLSHRDYEQVVLDVNRSLKRFPPAMKESHREKLQEQLTKLIMRVLVNNPQLHYYQGYHDICVTFLLILGQDLSFLVVDALSKSHLRDFMDEDMNRTRHMLDYLYPILQRADPELDAFMKKSEVGTIFCLSWLITWYGHVLDDAKHTVRLYDFFLASHPLMPIYLAAAIVLYRREEVLSTECEMCFVHVCLSQVPTDLPFEQLISDANHLFSSYPPSDLAEEAEFEYDNSKTIKNFAKFEKDHGLPSSEFKSDRSTKQITKSDSVSHNSILFRVGMFTLTAAMGVAIVAVQYTSKNMW